MAKVHFSNSCTSSFCSVSNNVSQNHKEFKFETFAHRLGSTMGCAVSFVNSVVYM